MSDLPETYESEDSMATPKWADELNLEQKLAKVEANAAAVTALTTQVEELKDEVKELRRQLATKELEAPRQTQQTTTRPRWQSKRRAAQTNHTCNATRDCVGHTEERHVTVHKNQVLKQAYDEHEARNKQLINA